MKGVVYELSWTAAIDLSDGSCRALTKDERDNPDEFLPKGAKLYGRRRLTSVGASTTGRSDPWIYNANAAQGRMDFLSDRIMWKLYADEILGVSISATNWDFQAPRDKTYAVQTPQAVIERCILMTTDPGHLVLDPTCGSGTTAVAAEKWGRRWITSDSSAVAVEVAKRRLLAQTYDWYMLQDSEDGAALEHELSGGDPSAFVPRQSYDDDLREGFVYERQRKLSAAMIAYNRYEYIYFVDRHRIKSGINRVTSSFTVESDSPFRSESPELRKRGVSAAATRERALEAIVSSGLNCGGRQVKVKDFKERDGAYLTHGGLLTSKGEQPKTALFHIADEDVVISPAHVRMIRREAHMSGDLPDVLVIIAFGREASSVSDMWSQGGMDVWLMMANRDLMIPQLDNGKGSRTAFALLSEPELTVSQTQDGML